MYIISEVFKPEVESLNVSSHTIVRTTHLERNFNWMAPSYVGGSGQPTVPPHGHVDVLNNSLNIQEILSKK